MSSPESLDQRRQVASLRSRSGGTRIGSTFRR
jgi:hypothetical protein